LQCIYSARAKHKCAVFRSLVQISINDAFIELLILNACTLRAPRGRRWGAFDRDPMALGSYP
ncbi:hypothetical protein HETIRDRAFT_224279, partial [Heterobasidion irregulare TC 32-1]